MLEDDIALQSKENEQLRIESRGLQLRLNCLKKEVKVKEKEILVGYEKVSTLQMKLKEASKLTDNVASLKKFLIDLYHSTIMVNQSHDNNEDLSKSLCDRERENLKKKIKGTADIIDRERKTHNSNISRLKNERNILLKVRLLFLLTQRSSFEV